MKIEQYFVRNIGINIRVTFCTPCVQDFPNRRSPLDIHSIWVEYFGRHDGVNRLTKDYIGEIQPVKYDGDCIRKCDKCPRSIH